MKTKGYQRLLAQVQTPAVTVKPLSDGAPRRLFPPCCNRSSLPPRARCHVASSFVRSVAVVWLRRGLPCQARVAHAGAAGRIVARTPAYHHSPAAARGSCRAGGGHHISRRCFSEPVPLSSCTRPLPSSFCWNCAQLVGHRPYCRAPQASAALPGCDERVSGRASCRRASVQPRCSRQVCCE